MPKIQVTFVNEDQLELGCDDERREKAIYIQGTLKVHYVTRTIRGSDFCSLHFCETTTSEKEMASQSYEIGSLPQSKTTLEERIEKEKARKMEKGI